MNVAASIGPGPEAMENGGAKVGDSGAVPSLAGHTTAWNPSTREGVDWAGNARGGTSPSWFAGSQSFQSSWQAMLRASGGGLELNRASTEADTRDVEQASSTRSGLAGQLGSESMSPPAGNVAAQTGWPRVALPSPATSEFENAGSAGRNAARVLEARRADAKSGPESTESDGPLSSVHGDRVFRSGKRAAGTTKLEAGPQAFIPKSWPNLDAGLPAAVQTPVMLAMRAPADLCADVGGDSQKLPIPTDGREGEIGTRVGAGIGRGIGLGIVPGVRLGSIAGAVGTELGQMAASTGSSERVVSSPQIAHGVGPTRNEMHGIDPGGAVDVVSGMPGRGVGNEQTPSPEPNGAAAGEGQTNPIQIPHRTGNQAAIPQESAASASSATVHPGGEESAPGAVETASPAPERDRASMNGSRAVVDKEKPQPHGINTGNPSSDGKDSFVARPAEISEGAAATVRIPSEAHPDLGAAIALTTHASGGEGPTTKETLAELDAGTAVGAPRWIHATGQQLEAGFDDPALGWVGVKANLSGDGVHAVLMPGTAEAAQILSAHLAGLHAHLAEQHAQVSTLTLADSAANNGGAGAGQSMQQSTGQNQNAQSGGPEQTQWNPQNEASSAADRPRTEIAVQGSATDSNSNPGGIRGTHISVIA